MRKYVCQACAAGRKESSPLVFALIVAVFGTAGALFLTNVEEVRRLVDRTLRTHVICITVAARAGVLVC